MKISVSIAVSSGESQKLKDCLSSIVGFADEILVFNIGEHEFKLARGVGEFPARVINHELVDYVEAIRNEMIEECSGEWIFILDPDERLSKDLKKKLREIAKEGNYDAVNIPRKNIFFGKWIKHTNWWPDRLVRFFKKGRVVWSTKIHSYPQVMGRQIDLPARKDLAIIHYGYDKLDEFIERQNRYSEMEAQNLASEGIRASAFNFIWWPFREFLARYVKHLGFMDGTLGFVLVYLMIIYKMTVWVKVWERSQK